MEDGTEKVEAVLFKEGSKGEKKLLVIARRIEKEQWQLSVQNECGISSNWIEFFSTARLAVDAGLEAIEKEGVEPFLDTEGFGYLFDENI